MTLSRDDVLAAAVQLADESGLAALSMRKLAQRLGVEAMSIYHHVPNKDAIIDGMVDSVFAEIFLPQPGQPWRVALRERTISVRDVLVRHRWPIGVMDSRAQPGPATLRHLDAVIGTLREGGFSVIAAAHAISAIDSYVYGFALQEVSLPFESPDELDEVAAGIMSEQMEAAFPYMAELIVNHALQPGYNYADEFEFGLDLVLDGIERYVAAGG